jgi:hypothetical protein
MGTRRLVAALAIGGLLVGIGVVAGQAAGGAAPSRVQPGPSVSSPPTTVPTSSTTTTTTTTPSGTVVLTRADDGTTVVAVIGDEVVVRLAGGTLRWSTARVAPTPSSAAPVLVRLSGGVTTTGSSTTTFRVAGHGLAWVEATGTAACPGGGVCPTYVVLWQAGVSVPVVDPPGTP